MNKGTFEPFRMLFLRTKIKRIVANVNSRQ